MRLVRIALLLSVAGAGKLALLGVLLATGIVVFLTVTGLSRASSDALVDQVDGALGETGSYHVDLLDGVGLPPDELQRRLVAIAEAAGARDIQLVEVVPPVTPDCPPLEALGEQAGLIVETRGGRPAAIPYGEGLPPGTQFCLDGQVIPGTALSIPDGSLQRTVGLGIIVHPDWADVLRLATTGPILHRLVMTTGLGEDSTDAIAAAVDAHLAGPAERAGVDLAGSVVIRRVDQGEGIRSASEGIAVVYRLIGVGVLGLGALALLVAETIVVRQRLWLFGLVRALGGRARHVVVLIAVDVATVVAVGVGIALAMCVATQSVLTPFAVDAFDTDIRLLQASSMPALVAGVVGILVLATSYPAWLAVRDDPASVLERP